MSPSSKKKSNILVQGGTLAAASLISRFIGLLYRIPMTNIIGDGGTACYSQAFEIYNIILILSSYSLPTAVSKMVAVRRAKREYRNSYRIFLGSMLFAIVSGGIAACVLFFGADFFAGILNSPGSVMPLKILAPTIFCSAIMGVLRGFYQGKETMIPTAVSQVIEQIINAFVSVGAAAYLMRRHSASADIESYGAAGGTLGTLIGALTGLVFLAFVFFAYYPTLAKQNRRDMSGYQESYHKIFKVLILTIVPIIFSQTVYQISSVIDNGMFGTIMVQGKGMLVSLKEELIGNYNGKYKLLVTVPVSIATAMATSLVPSIVAALAKGAMTEVKRKIHIVVKFNMIIAVPAAIGMTVLAKPIILLLFPSTNVDMAANLVTYGSVAVIFFSLSTVTNAVLQGINYMRLPVIHSGISLMIHVVIVYLCLQVFNMSIYGLVIGNITFPLVVCILNWISIGRKINYKQEVVKTFLIPLLSALIMGILAKITYIGIHQMVRSNLLGIFAALIVALVSYFLALIGLKGVTEDEFYEIPKGATVIRFAKRFHLM